MSEHPLHDPVAVVAAETARLNREQRGADMDAHLAEMTVAAGEAAVAGHPEWLPDHQKVVDEANDARKGANAILVAGQEYYDQNRDLVQEAALRDAAKDGYQPKGWPAPEKPKP